MITAMICFLIYPGQALSCPMWAVAGSAQIQLGSIAIELDGNEFSHATPDNPLFLRIGLGPDLALGETRVGLASDPAAISEPIFLPIIFTDNEPLEISQQPDMVSIVRWREGEHDIWLQISAPSTEWFGLQTSPKTDRRVRFAIGLSVPSLSEFSSAFFLAGKANLMVSQRVSGQIESTEIHAVWNPQRSESNIYLTLSLYQECKGLRALENPAGLLLGSPLGQGFDQPVIVARVMQDGP